MQNNVGRNIGVSPAYFISMYGTDFSCTHIEKEIRDLKDDGYNSLQLEIFEEKVFPEWFIGGGADLFRSISEYEMNISVFVAHYIGRFISSEKSNFSEISVYMNRLLQMLKPLDEKIPVAIPILPASENSSPSGVADIIVSLSDLSADYGRDLLLEIVPGSAAESYSDFMKKSVWAEAADKCGFLLDTGHANVSGNDPVILMEDMGDKLKALHLCDNNGIDNLSLPPGRGTINWQDLFIAIEKICYTGSLDLEISADKKELSASYKEGKDFIEKIIDKTTD